jgi:galactitol-specific phosphotransferase system IIB component
LPLFASVCAIAASKDAEASASAARSRRREARRITPVMRKVTAAARTNQGVGGGQAPVQADLAADSIATGAVGATKTVKTIVFACDAGMGSSAMGASVLRNKIKKAGVDDVSVTNKAIANLDGSEGLYSAAVLVLVDDHVHDLVVLRRVHEVVDRHVQRLGRAPARPVGELLLCPGSAALAVTGSAPTMSPDRSREHEREEDDMSREVLNVGSLPIYVDTVASRCCMASKYALVTAPAASRMSAASRIASSFDTDPEWIRTDPPRHQRDEVGDPRLGALVRPLRRRHRLGRRARPQPFTEASRA